MNVTKAEFNAFVAKQDRRHAEIMSHLQTLGENVGRLPSANRSETVHDNPYEKYKGFIANPATGRNREKTSFVNVGASLKEGIENHNASASREDRIDVPDFDMPLRAWTHSAMDVTRTIIAKHPALNEGLGKTTIHGAKSLPHFNQNPQKYNRVISAVVLELKQVLPILNLANGNWAPRQLLRNVFQNARARQRANETKNNTSLDNEVIPRSKEKLRNARKRNAEEIEDFMSGSSEEEEPVSWKKSANPAVRSARRSSKGSQIRKKNSRRGFEHTLHQSTKRKKKTISKKRILEKQSLSHRPKRVKHSQEIEETSQSLTESDSLET